MKSFIESFDVLIFSISLFILIISARRAIQLQKLYLIETLKKIWLKMIILISIFCFAYLVIVIAALKGKSSDISQLTPIVYFLGSLFVFLSVSIATRMNSKIRKYMLELESLVAYRTRDLEEAQKIGHIGSFEVDLVENKSTWSNEIYRILELNPQLATPSMDLYFSMIHSDDKERVRAAADRGIQEGTPFEGDRRIITQEGKIKYIYSKTVPELNKESQVTFLRGIVLDVTERKNTEIAMAYQAKMSSLGEMAGGLAHELNTPLTIINLKACQLKEHLESPPIDVQLAIQWTEKIAETTVRAANILKGLRNFAKESDGEDFELTFLNTLFDETIGLCNEKFKSCDISLKLNTSAELKLECRRAQICQIILSLLMNSFDAVKNLDEKWIAIESQDCETSIKIKVTDSGNGIRPEIRDKIMQPFFTTKKIGLGIGMGLSISKGIAEANAGRLELDETQPHTCFVLTLPKYQIKNPVS